MDEIFSKTFCVFSNFLEIRFKKDVFTTEDSVRYSFFHSILSTFSLSPHNLILEHPHPKMLGKKLDAILSKTINIPECVFEFKFDKQMPSGYNGPRPQKAGSLFHDLYRLSQYKQSYPPSRCFFVYVTDNEMFDYLKKPENNLADFFELKENSEFLITEEFIKSHSQTFIESTKNIFNSKIICSVKKDFENNFALRIYEIIM